MIRTVYADLLFLINFSMDYLCFFLVSRLLSHKLPKGRTALASAFGAIYAVLTLFLPFRGLLLFLCDAFTCVLMCLIQGLRKGGTATAILREALIYTGVSMALGGIMTATYTALGEIGLGEPPKEGDGISAGAFFLLAVIGGGASLLGSGALQNRSHGTRYDVTVGLCGREVTCRAMVDTGNALRDPISGCPAAALHSVVAAPLFHGVDASLLAHPVECISALPPTLRERIRLLPTTTVTGDGMLLAFRPDKCLVTRTDRNETVELAVLIALAPIRMEDADMLLPSGIFTP